MAVVKEQRASDRAYETLLEEIQTGVLAPGSVLAEVEQAKRLGISRTPMREAIGKLISAGLAKQLSARTTVVTGFDVQDIKKLFELRRALEEQAVRLAAIRAEKEVFADLAKKFAAFAAGDHADQNFDINDYYRLIALFDEELDTAIDNPYMVQALLTVRTHLKRARNLARDNKERLLQSAAEHLLIVRAVAAGDQELAAHATHVHLHNAYEAIINSISEGQK